jgi:hypothetical protein
MERMLEWDGKVAWMRGVGATSATFSPVTNELVSVTLGPPPASETGDDEPATQQKPSPEEAHRRERDERRRIAMAASGGPLRRVEVDERPLAR